MVPPSTSTTGFLPMQTRGYLLEEDDGVDAGPIVGGVDGEELLRVGIYRGPHVDLPPLDFQFFVSSMATDYPPLLGDARDYPSKGVDPVEYGDAARPYQSGLVGHRAIGESRQVEQGGNDLCLRRNFIPLEDVCVLDGLQQRVVGFTYVRYALKVVQPSKQAR